MEFLNDSLSIRVGRASYAGEIIKPMEGNFDPLAAQDFYSDRLSAWSEIFPGVH